MSSYQVIARKWRPGVFEEVVGQAHITRTLRNAVSSGRIAHAYLFSGPRGVGKTTAARILAKCLNCAIGPTATPCGTCPSCKAVAGGSSVDVFEIDGASNNSVDNVREISESVRYVPSEGRYKVYIIDEVHMLSTAAFNALLKTLEEPPPHAVFIFATTEVHRIPATILSRCQRFDFKRIPFRDIQAHLEKIVAREGIACEDKALYLIAREADGSLRDSQSLLEQALAFAGGELKGSDAAEALGLMDRTVLYDLSGAIAGKDAAACLNIVEKIYDFGYDLRRGCSDLLEHIRDLTVLKVTGEPSLLDLPDSELERLQETAARVSAERLHMLFAIISKGYEEVSRSAHPRYALEMALLKAAHFDELEPLGELVARLERLKGAPGGQQRPEPQPKQQPQAFRAAPGQAEARQEPASQARKVSAPPDEKAQATQGADPGPMSAPAGLAEFIGKRSQELSELLKGASVEASGDAVSIKGREPRIDGKLQVNRAAIEACLKDFFGRPVALAIGASGGGAEKKRPDTILKDALRILGGRIIEDRRRGNV